MQLLLDIGADAHLLDSVDVSRSRAEAQPVKHVHDLLVLSRAHAALGAETHHVTPFPGSTLRGVLKLHQIELLAVRVARQRQVVNHAAPVRREAGGLRRSAFERRDDPRCAVLGSDQGYFARPVPALQHRQNLLPVRRPGERPQPRGVGRAVDDTILLAVGAHDAQLRPRAQSGTVLAHLVVTLLEIAAPAQVGDLALIGRHDRVRSRARRVAESARLKLLLLRIPTHHRQVVEDDETRKPAQNRNVVLRAYPDLADDDFLRLAAVRVLSSQLSQAGAGDTGLTGLVGVVQQQALVGSARL